MINSSAPLIPAISISVISFIRFSESESFGNQDMTLPLEILTPLFMRYVMFKLSPSCTLGTFEKSGIWLRSGCRLARSKAMDRKQYLKLKLLKNVFSSGRTNLIHQIYERFAFIFYFSSPEASMRVLPLQIGYRSIPAHPNRQHASHRSLRKVGDCKGAMPLHL